jgi:hypothetical protein
MERKFEYSSFIIVMIREIRGFSFAARDSFVLSSDFCVNSSGASFTNAKTKGKTQPKQEQKQKDRKEDWQKTPHILKHGSPCCRNRRGRVFDGTHEPRIAPNALK